MSFTSEVTADSPDRWWQFDLSSGTSVTEAVGANSGSLSNSSAVYNATPLSNDWARSLQTDAHSLVDAQLPTTALSRSSPFTIEIDTVWEAGTTLFRDNTSAGGTGWMIYDSSGTVTARCGGTDISTSVSTASVRDGKKHLWQIVVVSLASVLVYCDGVQVGSGTAGVGSVATPWHVGRNGAATTYSELRVGNFIQYGSALSSTRITAHYDAWKANLAPANAGVPVVQETTQAEIATASASWVVNKPNRVASGDLLLVCLGARGSLGTITPPSGWTAGPVGVNTAFPYLYSYWRVADGTEGSTFTFTGTTAQTGAIACSRITGAHASSPIGSSSAQYEATSPVVTAPSITVGANALLYSFAIAQTVTNDKWLNTTARQEHLWANYASSVVAGFAEEVTASGATGTRSFQQNSSAGDRSVLMIEIKPPAASTVSVGQATETDTSQPVGKLKTLATGQASEVDLSQPMAKSKALALGMATSAETALPITALKTIPVGQPSETDTAQAVAFFKRRGVGQALEGDAAMPIAPGRFVAVGQAFETDTAGTHAVLKARGLGVAQEADVATAIFTLKAKAIAQVAETDDATAVGVGKAVSVGTALELDEAGGITAVLTLRDLVRLRPIATDTSLASSSSTTTTGPRSTSTSSTSPTTGTS